MGWLDLVALKYAHEINDYSEICLTKIDILSKLDEIPICVGYSIDGEVFDIFHEWAIISKKSIKPIYKTLKGWNCSIRGITNFSDLPIAAKDYIKFIEDHLGIPATIIGTGPENEEIIVRDDSIKSN